MSDEKINETPNGELVIAPGSIPESPKPAAFVIDFGIEKIDPQRRKNMVEKLEKRHRRGQSLSKLDDTPSNTIAKKYPLTGNLPRKSSFQSEGYFSADEKTEKAKSAKNNIKHSNLTLQLRNTTLDNRMTQSFPANELTSIISPDVELKDVSSPELDLISPFSPKDQIMENNDLPVTSTKKTTCNSESENIFIASSDDNFIAGSDFDFDKSDTVSDAGTYTLDAENYSEEQKARMSIDRDFNVEQVSVQRKTEDYIRSLAEARKRAFPPLHIKDNEIVQAVQILKLNENDSILKSPKSPGRMSLDSPTLSNSSAVKVLSPIMSPTQSLSITHNMQEIQLNNNGENSDINKTFTKIMFPSSKSKNEGLDQLIDQGSVISVTSSGAFRSKTEKPKRKYSLSKSEVQVEAFIDDRSVFHNSKNEISQDINRRNSISKLTANIVNIQNIEVKKANISVDESLVSADLNLKKLSNTSNLPPAVGGYSGKNSPTKIPSPIHSNRPRSRSSMSSQNVYLSDSSLDTENILKPTQNYINSLQQRLSIDSDPDSDFETKYGIQLNNTAHLLKQRTSHIRHNSLDDKVMNISNKLEHFQNKNLQGIDQTFSNVFNQYGQNKVMHKIQNSPNNSPIRRSSSFSTKNQINSISKNTNITHKDLNRSNSPNISRNAAIQRSSSSVCIKPYSFQKKSSLSEHQKIDRSQFGDTESSSEDDCEKNLHKRRDLANITNTRCNRAFSLRRARIDNEPSAIKCPNTPEMRRKYQSEVKAERAISVDRKPVKTNEVQSRYLLNITKRNNPLSMNSDVIKNVPKVSVNVCKSASSKPPAFSRTDSGRFSMRTPKPPVSSATKNVKKDANAKKTGSTRSNSSLSSREVEFQNWKRRKSYDPMKAAAEGKRRQEIAKKQGNNLCNTMTQSYTESNNSQDSSPSHSSSVHRSQSFHGTAALEQLISSEDEEDLTLSADEGFSPPTPSPCELSPARAVLRHSFWTKRNH